MSSVNNMSPISFLREIASLSYGSREGAAGGKGNIGIDASLTAVKFNTHLADRIKVPSAKEKARMVFMCNKLRDELMAIASKVGGDGEEGLEFQKDIARMLGCKKVGSIYVNPKKLLDRKVTAAVVDKLLDRCVGSGAPKSVILEEAKAMAASSQGLDTSFTTVRTRGKDAKLRIMEEGARVATGESHTINRGDGFVKLAQELKEAILDPKGQFAKYFVGFRSRKLKAEILELLSAQTATGAMGESRRHYTGAKAIQYNLGILLNLGGGSKKAMANIKLWGEPRDSDDGAFWSDRTYNKFKSRLIKQLHVSLEKMAKMALNQDTIKANNIEPICGLGARGVPQNQHPDPGVNTELPPVGTFFKQGKNTCFLISFVNALMCSENGRKNLASRLFPTDEYGQLVVGADGNDKHYSVVKSDLKGMKYEWLIDWDDATEDTVGGNFAKVKDKRGFSMLEKTLFAYCEPSDPDAKLGKMGTAEVLGPLLGCNSSGEYDFCEGKPAFLRRQWFNEIAAKFRNNEVCLLYRGEPGVTLTKHYMAITGIYQNENDPDDYGFYVSDSQTGKVRKIKADYGGDSGWPFATPLRVFTFSQQKPLTPLPPVEVAKVPKAKGKSHRRFTFSQQKPLTPLLPVEVAEVPKAKGKSHRRFTFSQQSPVSELMMPYEVPAVPKAKGK